MFQGRAAFVAITPPSHRNVSAGGRVFPADTGSSPGTVVYASRRSEDCSVESLFEEEFAPGGKLGSAMSDIGSENSRLAFGALKSLKETFDNRNNMLPDIMPQECDHRTPTTGTAQNLATRRLRHQNSPETASVDALKYSCRQEHGSGLSTSKVIPLLDET